MTTAVRNLAITLLAEAHNTTPAWVEEGLDADDTDLHDLINNGSDEEWAEAAAGDVVALVNIRSRIGLALFT